MLTVISFLWNKCRYRVKSFNEMEHAINWGNTYEQHEKAQAEDIKWDLKIKKYQWEAWSFFGLFIIELHRLIKEYNHREKVDFDLVDNYIVFLDKKRTEIRTFSQMVKFMRHGFCHPEEDASLRLDPYVLDRLNKQPKELDRSYHRVHFLKDSSNQKYYVQIGGGKLYFDEINHAIRKLNKVLKTTNSGRK